MKKLLISLGAAALLSTATFANSTVVNPYEDEFAKMNQYFNSLIETHFNSAALQNMNYPRTDIIDNDKKIVLKFDLAGVPKENIKLTIDANNILTLKGEKKSEVNDKSKGYVKKEIFYGTFQKVIQLPENIKQDKLTTEFKNGVLTVAIPKKEIKKPKAKIIPIK